MKVPISDCHTHTNPLKGLGMRIVAKKFRDVGGWFIGLVSLPPSHYGLDSTPEGYKKSYDLLIEEAAIAREAGLSVRTFIGIHPADVDKLVIKLGTDRALSIVDNVLKIIEDYIKRGIVDGLGEFGRPHYKSVPESFSINEYLTLRALELARDYDVPIHLHLEQKGLATVRSISAIAKILGIGKTRVIVHHVDTKTALSCSEEGYPHTALARYELLKSILHSVSDVSKTLVESDHIDDPKRPGVAMYPWEIANSVEKLCAEGLEKSLHRILVDNVVRVFDTNPP